MPVQTFSITKVVRTPGEQVLTNSFTVPSGILEAKIQMNMDIALINDPTVDCEAGIQWAEQGTPVNGTWKKLGSTRLIGNVLNDPVYGMPYVVIGKSSIDAVVGKLVRGYLTATTAMTVGADLTITT